MPRVDERGARLARIGNGEERLPFRTVVCDKGLIGRRIDKAIEMMKTTDLSIREIAERVGYVNSNYFYKLFKKYMGLNPGEFQAQLS